jgi:glutaminyl-tRNA synthetase
MVAKNELLEQTARKELDDVAPRRFAVLSPLRVELQGLPDGSKSFPMPNHPKEESYGTRPLKLTSTIYIERSDFRPDLASDSKYYGLAVGREAGLLGAGVNITVTDAVHDKATGELSHLVATADTNRERKVKGHLHWVSAETAVAAECRVYGVLFTPEDPENAAKKAEGETDGADGEEEEEEAESGDGVDLPPWLKLLNPKSLTVEHALIEPALAAAAAPPAKGKNRPAFQFQRVGFFCVDDESTVAKPVFNRIVALKEDRERRAL